MPELAKRPRFKIGHQLQLKSRGPQWVGALHTALYPGEKEFETMIKPEGLSWEEFAKRDAEGYKSALRWAALLNRVKEWLGPQYIADIRRWMEAVRTDLRKEQ